MRPVLVVAVRPTRTSRAIAEALAPAVARVIATRYQQERALAPDALAARFARPASPRSTPPTTCAPRSRARAPVGAPVLIAGSLFLVGEARALLLGAPADPIATSDPAGPR